MGVFALLVMAGPWVGRTLPAGTLMALVVLVSMPHYGATLLRVYEKREERQAYAFFAKYTTILLGLAFVWGLNNVGVGSLLFTIYLTWSPWHYTGQNYGVALMFLGRQGVKVSQPTKRLLYASFVLTYVINFFFIHSATMGSSYRGAEVEFVALGIPAIAADREHSPFHSGRSDLEAAGQSGGINPSAKKDECERGHADRSEPASDTLASRCGCGRGGARRQFLGDW